MDSFWPRPASFFFPSLHGTPALLTHPADEVAVEHDEGETETLVEFVLPLQDNGRRRCDDNAANTLPHEELTHDQIRRPGSDNLSFFAAW